MELFDFFTLIWEHRNTHAFMAILAYAPIWIPSVVLFVKIMEAREMRSLTRRAQAMATLTVCGAAFLFQVKIPVRGS